MDNKPKNKAVLYITAFIVWLIANSITIVTTLMAIYGIKNDSVGYTIPAITIYAFLMLFVANKTWDTIIQELNRRK